MGWSHKQKIMYFYTLNKVMFEFDQYLGFLAFLSILTIGFWLMIFLLTFVIPYWLVGAIIEQLKYGKNKLKIEKRK